MCFELTTEWILIGPTKYWFYSSARLTARFFDCTCDSLPRKGELTSWNKIVFNLVMKLPITCWLNVFCLCVHFSLPKMLCQAMMTPNASSTSQNLRWKRSGKKIMYETRWLTFWSYQLHLAEYRRRCLDILPSRRNTSPQQMILHFKECWSWRNLNHLGCHLPRRGELSDNVFPFWIAWRTTVWKKRPQMSLRVSWRGSWIHQHRNQNQNQKTPIQIAMMRKSLERSAWCHPVKKKAKRWNWCQNFLSEGGLFCDFYPGRQMAFQLVQNFEFLNEKKEKIFTCLHEFTFLNCNLSKFTLENGNLETTRHYVQAWFSFSFCGDFKWHNCSGK